MTVDQFLLLAFAVLVFLAAVIVYVVIPARRRRLIKVPPPEPAAPPAPSEPPPAPVGDLVLPPAAGPPDDLRQLKGVGPKLATLLNELGITTFAQIASLDAAQLAALDSRLGTFQGRPMRDRWQEQAALLAAGDRAGFERLMGRLGEG
ncbi:MAG: helix-hairpin-helix domain-containing protein, partial [Sphingomonadaceae bacterium]